MNQVEIFYKIRQNFEKEYTEFQQPLCALFYALLYKLFDFKTKFALHFKNRTFSQFWKIPNKHLQFLNLAGVTNYCIIFQESHYHQN